MIGLPMRIGTGPRSLAKGRSMPPTMPPLISLFRFKVGASAPNQDSVGDHRALVPVDDRSEQRTPAAPEGWVLRWWGPQCREALVLPHDHESDTSTVPLYIWNLSGTGIVRYSTTAARPSGWNDSTGFQGQGSIIARLLDHEASGTIPVYQLSKYDPSLRTWLQIVTSSWPETLIARELGWTMGVPQDFGQTEPSEMTQEILGYAYPAHLTARLSATGNGQADLGPRQGEFALLPPHDRLEITLDDSVEGGKLTQVLLYADDGNEPAGEPFLDYRLVDGLTMNIAHLGGVDHDYRVWQLGRRTVTLVHRSHEPFWYHVRFTDAVGAEHTLDPEILDRTGGQRGPTWSTTRSAGSGTA